MICGKKRGLATPNENQLGRAGIEHPQEMAGKAPVSTQGGAESGALNAQTPSLPPDLAGVVDAWPSLPPAIRAGILAMIQAAKGGAA